MMVQSKTERAETVSSQETEKRAAAKAGQKKLTKYFEYLDTLRESGITNMHGASPYLADAFNLKRDHAIQILSAWMKTFSDKPASERAASAIEANL